VRADDFNGGNNLRIFMKNYLEDVRYATADQWFTFILTSAVAIALIVILTFVVSNKTVSCYYPITSIPTQGTQVLYKVKADINWASDETAFISSRPEDMILFMSLVKECSAKN
jgi:hypothetical protein